MLQLILKYGADKKVSLVLQGGDQVTGVVNTDIIVNVDDSVIIYKDSMLINPNYVVRVLIEE